MPKWLLHNCHCHRPQEIPSENFQASLCPPIVPSARRRLETYDSSPWYNVKYLMLRCLQWWHDWWVVSVSWPQPGCAVPVRWQVSTRGLPPCQHHNRSLCHLQRRNRRKPQHAKQRRLVFLEVNLVLQSELDNFEFGNKLQRASVVPCDRTGPGWAGSCSSLLWPSWWMSPVCSTDHISAATESLWFITINNFLPGNSQLF